MIAQQRPVPPETQYLHQLYFFIIGKRGNALKNLNVWQELWRLGAKEDGHSQRGTKRGRGEKVLNYSLH